MKLLLDTVLAGATKLDVNAEWDRRMAVGFVYLGKTIQANDKSMGFIAVAAGLAKVAVDAGAQPGDYRWMTTLVDYQWKTYDNTYIKLDAPGVLDLLAAASMFSTKMQQAADALKTRIASGEKILDVTRAALWPT